MSEAFDRSRIQISDERLAELIERFTPLYRPESSLHIYKIEIPDLRNTAFTWAPKKLDMVEFEPIKKVSTLHSCAYYGFFKPSIAEVLAHVKDDGTDWGNAFFIDMENVEIHPSGEGHIAVTYFGKI